MHKLALLFTTGSAKAGIAPNPVWLYAEQVAFGKSQRAHVLYQHLDQHLCLSFDTFACTLNQGKGRVKKCSLLITTDPLQLTLLIRRHLLRRRAFLVEDVVEADTDGDGIADVGDEIRSGDTEGDGGVVDVVDEIVHVWRWKVHEAMDLA